jgi:hypothetical protein
MSAPARITDQTSPQVSTDLKTLFTSKGIFFRPHVDETFYYQGNLVLVISETQYGLRVLVANQSGGTGFDYIKEEDFPDLTRAWSLEELNAIIALYPASAYPPEQVINPDTVVSMSECEMVDGVCTHRIRFNGQIIQATDTNKANAIAKCFLACLEGEWNKYFTEPIYYKNYLYICQVKDFSMWMFKNNLIPEQGDWNDPLSDLSIKVYDAPNNSWTTISEAHERFTRE